MVKKLLKSWKIKILCGAALLVFATPLFSAAQERVAPVAYNPVMQQQFVQTTGTAQKTTSLSLPFFEDFTDYSPVPDVSKWMDRQVYVNNTMGIDPISRGVATFDALNQYGLPYDTGNTSKPLIFADSLTSQYIDLSTYQASDSIYLSFFYQPEGNGFYPEPQDSLNLYLKRENNTWARVWFAPGAQLHAFKQVMISVADPNYLHDSFQFRFVNKASIFTNDDVWNVDYIRLDANRTFTDTFINDVAFSVDPTNMLNDLTAMPYRQFTANINAELATTHSATIKNNYQASHNISCGYTAREQITNTPLFSSGFSYSSALSAVSSGQVNFPMYNTPFNATHSKAKVVFENKYMLQSPTMLDVKLNDTIVKQQVFDNYMAYDDGTAEKSYYLNLFATLPGKLAVEYHLNQPDTLRAIAIYFGRQLPLATQKFFSLTVYTDISVGAAGEQKKYQQDLQVPGYLDINNFYIYKLDQPVLLDAGKFYIGITQPALSNSDSLYLGLDVNRTMPNHVFYNVLDKWEPSQIQGAVMIRPILGQEVFGTSVQTNLNQPQWTIYPNPADKVINFRIATDETFTYQVQDIQGRILKTGRAANGSSLDVADLTSGMYIIRLTGTNGHSTPKRIIIQ